MNDPLGHAGDRCIRTAAITRAERYQLLTSLVVPRPIAWISSRSAAGVPNLAPFSYFAAISPTPMLVAVSIGHRHGEPKDSLRNIREVGEFCINVVSELHLRVMNESSADHGPEVDEFEVVGLRSAEATAVAAPYVADCPAVLECRLFKEVELEGAMNTLIVGEVVAVRLAGDLEFVAGTSFVDPASLRPIGRLGGASYSPVETVVSIPRPVIPPA